MGFRRKRNKKMEDEDMGFGNWGGYMAAKRAKLVEQFHETEISRVSDIFEGISIHVNGLTKPPIDELKKMMAAHGGVFHAYQVSGTTHIIASNLPNVKIKHLGMVPIVKPTWITDSIHIGKLLDYRRYLLYTNQSKSQHRLEFPIVEKRICNSIQNLSNSEKSDILENKETNNFLFGSCVADKRNMSIKTASDPNFLQEFYSNSRLHLISTLGAEFKQLVSQMRENAQDTFPGLQKLVDKHSDNNKLVFNKQIIMHIDMDCFFVSVGLRNHPELRGMPVAITHARNGQLTNVTAEMKANREQEIALYAERLPPGVTSRVDKIDAQSSMSEIASCSYEARKYGIKNGMFLGQAIKMCPELKTLPYDFEGYKQVSSILYKTIATYTLDIEAVSCDEMYVNITNILQQTGMTVEEWASHIREEIMTATGCPCSTGFGANRLQARLATRKAKPAGQYYLVSEDVESYMAEIPLADLPGVGKATLAKLQNLGLYTCGDVQMASLKDLQSHIGQKGGETLKNQARGIDNKPLNFSYERKSVSAEVNYGIRFTTLEECYNFLNRLSEEVYNRLQEINMKARCVTLKLLVRAAEAPVETAKYLGHGICDSFSKSTTLNISNDPRIIFREVKNLYDKMNQHFAELRGVGIQLSKLERDIPVNNALSNFLKQMNASENTTKPTTVNEDLIDKSGKVAPMRKDDNETDLPMVKDNMKNKNTGLTSIASVPKQNVEKTKRGRPKGSRNWNNKITRNTDNNVSINHYFGIRKGGEQDSKTQPSSQNEEINLEILYELPEEIRKEIIKEYKLETKLKSSLVAVKEYANEKLNNKHENKTNINENGILSEKSAFSGLNWKQIKPIIAKWVQSEETPSQIDVEMIAMHFKQMAIQRQIEVLQNIFNFLHRIFYILKCDWHTAYFTIVNITQEGMVARYGRTLMINQTFGCCKV